MVLVISPLFLSTLNELSSTVTCQGCLSLTGERNLNSGGFVFSQCQFITNIYYDLVLLFFLCDFSPCCQRSSWIKLVMFLRGEALSCEHISMELNPPEPSVSPHLAPQTQGALGITAVTFHHSSRDCPVRCNSEARIKLALKTHSVEEGSVFDAALSHGGHQVSPNIYQLLQHIPLICAGPGFCLFLLSVFCIFSITNKHIQSHVYKLMMMRRRRKGQTHSSAG